MTPHGVLQLLDSAQGHPLQTWTIAEKDHVTIGRAEENDIVVADPYVSRAHAYLHFDPAHDEWRVISISRQQVVFQGEARGELPLADGMVFRLGQHGCYLRFGQSLDGADDRKTISFDATLMPVFALDRKKMQSEVNEIADGEYFQSLKHAASRLRQDRRAKESNAS
jgi:hypothetical protein